MENQESTRTETSGDVDGNIMDQGNAVIKNVLANEYVSAALTLFLIVYAATLAPKLTRGIAIWFDNWLVKVIIFFLIAYIHTANPTIALTSAIAVMVTLMVVNNKIMLGRLDNTETETGTASLPKKPEEQPEEETKQPEETEQPKETASEPAPASELAKAQNGYTSFNVESSVQEALGASQNGTTNPNLTVNSNVEHYANLSEDDQTDNVYAGIIPKEFGGEFYNPVTRLTTEETDKLLEGNFGEDNGAPLNVEDDKNNELDSPGDAASDYTKFMHKIHMNNHIPPIRR